jgi:hypothetical protein
VEIGKISIGSYHDNIFTIHIYYFYVLPQPDGAEGKGGPDALIDLFKNGWVMVSSYGTITKPFVCVDTEYGRIVVTFTMIANVND